MPFEPLRRRVAWWQAIAALVGSGLLVLGIVLLVGTVAGYTEILDALHGADPLWVALTPVAEALEVLGYILAFRVVLAFEGGPHIGRWLAARLVFASIGATRLFATAGAGGIAVVYWALRKAGRSRHEAIVRVLAANIAVFAFFGIGIGAAAVARLLGAGTAAPVWMAWGWLAIVSVCFTLALLLSGATWRERIAHPARPTRMKRLIADPIEAIALVRRLTRHAAARREAYGAIALYWAADVFGLWAGLFAFGVEISLPALILAYATGYVSITLPLPAGGAGGVDAAMTAALVAAGVPLAPALLGVLVYRFNSFLLPTLPGAAAMTTLPLLGREFDALKDDEPSGRASSS